MAVHHPLDTFTTSLGTSLGVEALCENAKPIERSGNARPPPLASPRNASSDSPFCVLRTLPGQSGNDGYTNTAQQSYPGHRIVCVA
jgi:hypothetical protein